MKKLVELALLCISSVLLWGCGDSSDNNNDLASNDGDNVVAFNFISLEAESRDGIKASWDAASLSNQITYVLCERDTDYSNDCDPVATTSHLEHIINARELLRIIDQDFFVIAKNTKGASVLSNELSIDSQTLTKVIAYIKASNTDVNDYFGHSVSLSADGTTLAVGAYNEGSSSIGINGDGTNNDAKGSGAAYLFRFDGINWSQQAYIKASNSENGDSFARTVALSADGNTLVVGASSEDSSSTSINGDESSNNATSSGAAYVYQYSGDSWTQQAYIKASNSDVNDFFAGTVAISDDGQTLAIGAYKEDSSSTGINGDESDNSAHHSGAVYVYRFDGANWLQQAYVKASNTDIGDFFGWSLALSADGDTLAVGAYNEDSSSVGVNGDESNNGANSSGATYLYRFDGTSWSQQAYIKASNADENDYFGWSVALDTDGNTLAVGAHGEDASSTGINSDETNNDASSSGATYIFRFNGTDWLQQAYIKASNIGVEDYFGWSVALSGSGDTLVVGAYGENSNSIGINSDDSNDAVDFSGAAYMFRYNGVNWLQSAYIKAPNVDYHDSFGQSVTISSDGYMVAIGAEKESSSSTGVNADQSNNNTPQSGAVYVY